jgi:hypothetical protein
MLLMKFLYPFKKPGEISEVCVEQENALDSNFGNFLPQNIEMIHSLLHQACHALSGAFMDGHFC